MLYFRHSRPRRMASFPMVRRASVGSFLSALFFALSLFSVSAPPAYAGCTDDAIRAGRTTQYGIDAIRSVEHIDAPASAWTCQRVCSAQARGSRCVAGGCSGGEETVCCPPGTGPEVTPQNANVCSPPAATSTARASGGVASILLPACTQTGDCSLDDLIETGASFANFLFGLSGAIFLLIFVYGGFRYVMSAGNAGEVGKAKDMIVNATIGMILMITATTLTRFIKDVITTDTGSVGQVSLCSERYQRQGFDCQIVPGDTAEEISRNATAAGCQRQANLCNLGGQEQMRCCPLTAPAASTPAPTTGAQSYCMSDADCTSGRHCIDVVGANPGHCE